MIKCSYCAFKNFDGTKFCQHCGKQLRKRRFLSPAQGGAIASMANPQMGLATFVGMQIEKDTTHHQRAVRVVPLNDGRWFCPDCGHLNQKFDTYCLGCGREIS